MSLRSLSSLKNRKTEHAPYGKTEQIVHFTSCRKTEQIANYAPCGKTRTILTDTKSKNTKEYANDTPMNYSVINALHIFDNVTLTFGSFDQFDGRFSNFTRGNQCTCNCLIYLAFATKNIDDQQYNLDDILEIGDQVYLKTVQNLKQEGRFRNMLLTLNEIPNVFEIRGQKIIVERKNVLFGTAVQFDSTNDFLTLQEALVEAFEKAKAALVMIGAICSGVYFDNDTYFFFDSHSHDKSGLYEPRESKGMSILIGFRDIQSLVNYMYSHYTSMHIDLQSQYEILPVKLIDMDNSLVLQRQINSYFKDQNRRNIIQISTKALTDECDKRKVYMKTYMQRRREDPYIHQRELNAKQKAREDDEVRQKELDAKRKTRRDDEVRQKELDAKRKMRRDDEVRQKELDAKRKARKDDQVNEKERLCKQASRNRDRSKIRNYDRSVKSQKRKAEEFACHESKLKKQKQQGSSLEQCIDIFSKNIIEGPTYLCTSCTQTWFSNSVVNACRIKQTVKGDLKQCFTDRKSVNNIEWICNTCLQSIRQNKIPRLSVANKMGFPVKPIELNLYPLEERLLSLRIPFMQIRLLPRGGQLSVKGNVVNVPVDVQPTINSLPHTLEKSGTIPIKLKKKLSYNKCDFSENVRPFAVLCALHYLMQNSDLYKTSGVQIDQNWIREITAVQNNDESEVANNTSNEDEETSTGDKFDEINEEELHAGNTDTLLDEVFDETSNTGSSQYVFAPGEGQRPLSLYNDTDAEYLAFPSIFCGQRRPDSKERLVSVHYSDIVKWELRSVDRRVAQSVPNLFFKLKKIQMKHINDRVNLALRRCKSEGKKWTVRDFLNPSTVNDIVKLDEGYYIFRSLRNSPVYLEKRKKDVFAMIRQLGLPTWFGSFSSADTNWKDLLRILGKLNDGKYYSDDELDQMDWNTKSRLVQKDPVTCSRFFDYRVQQFIKTVLQSDHDPIGKVIDYFYRVEFQQRGSPHIHMLIWIENAPIYEQDSNEDLVQFIDKYVSCSLSSAPSDLVSLQVHKHSKTCRTKGRPICRFGFPLPPLDETVILEPLDEDIDKYKAIYKEVQTKVDSLYTMDNVEDITFDELLNNVLQLSREDYIKAIRSNLSSAKVFLKRKPSEVRVNPYMKALLPAWKANHDLQFVLDPYACAVYIVSYISKSQKGMSGLLDQAAKEAREGNLDLKRQVRHIGNYFTNSVETCAQEAVYLLLQMPLTKATRHVVFINTSPPDKRTFLLKQTSELEKLSPDSTDVESNNDIKRYSKRPALLQNWCLADYISQLEVKFPASDDEQNKSESENESETEDELEMSNENHRKIKITLKNGIIIRQRKSQKVIRYVRYNRKTDSENFYRERLLLFYPWRNEQSDLKGTNETYESMYNSVRRIVESKAKQYEHNVEKLDKAIEEAENDCHQYDEIAPGTQQVELEDVEEGSTEADQYVHFNPDRPTEHRHYDISEEVGVAARTIDVKNHANRIEDDDYYKLIRSLNNKQREFFLHVLTWIKRKCDPLYLFLTGGAGVGKSVVVKALFQALHRHLCSTEGEDPDDIRILLCAPTGKAAYNINGLTIHNAFQIQPNKGLNQSLSCDVLNTLRMKYRNLSVVMIDEISMVGNKMFSLLDARLKKIKGSNQIFGGVSVIAIGDFFQLKPVFDGWIFQDLNKGISALSPNLWKELFKVHELTQIMRQKDDIEFAELLNRLRLNNLNDNDFAILDTRTVRIEDQSYNKNSTHLFVQNDLVDKFNNKFITNLTSEKVSVKAVDTVVGDFSPPIKAKLISSLPGKQSDTANLAKEVELAIGMKYDLTANIEVTDGLTNGSSCQVKLFEYKTKSQRPSIVWVKFNDEKIGTNTRKKYNHLYSQNIDKRWTPVFDIKRSFSYRYKNFERIQMPLRPAAGKTIHKSQGDTLKEVVVSLDSKCKGKIPHIHYVALSRVTTLSGLQILNLNRKNIAVSDCVKDEVERLKSEAVLSLCFKPLYSLPSENFKVVFNNSRSMHLHHEDIRADPSIMDADVIGIAESRLIPSDCNENYLFPGFQTPIRVDQNQKHPNTRPPHGLVVFLKNGCLLQRQLPYSTPTLEFLLVEIIVPNKGLFQVVFVYRASECSLKDLKTAFLYDLAPTLDLQHSNLIIMGDFNFDLLSGHDNFLNFMLDTFMCSQILTKPTRLYTTLLDHIFLNIDKIFHYETDILDAYWSDHQIIYVTVQLH